MTTSNNISNNDFDKHHQQDNNHDNETNGSYNSGNPSFNHVARRHQLYIGNLTWVCYNSFEFNEFINIKIF